MTISNRARSLTLSGSRAGSATSATAVLAQTALIYLLQLFCLVVAYETGHSPPPRDLPHPFFLIAPRAIAPAAPTASPSVRALEDLEAQPEDDPDLVQTGDDEDEQDWVPYTDFLSGPVARGSPVSQRRKGKSEAVDRPRSPSTSTSLLLPSERPPASGLSAVEGPSTAGENRPYLPSDDDPARNATFDFADAPIIVIRPLTFLSRCLGIGVHARPASEAEGGRFSEWEAFWHGSGAGSRRELLGLGMR